jgi:succinoglycan biosynthesis transport protein ExoP
MEIRNYLAILWRRKWVALITLIVTTAVVTIGTFLTTPTYSATAMLRIASAATGTVNYSDYMYADRLLNTYVTISTSKLVLDQLKQKVNLQTLPPIDVKTIPNTELIQITVDDVDPTRAANIANALADILVSQSTELYSGGGQSSLDILRNQLTEMENEVNQARQAYVDLSANNPADTEKIQAAQQTLTLKQKLYADLLDQYEQARLNEAIRAKSISVAEPAFPPLSPSKPNKPLNIALGFLVGGIGGVGLAFLFENLDTTLYTKEQIEDLTKLPNLGMIPDAKVQRLFISSNGSNPYIEAFRRIRTTIFRPDKENPVGTLLVTSPEIGEGKSTIVINLAYTLAQAGHKVIVVDGDLRVPNQHKLFNLPNEQGLSSVLMQTTNLALAIQESKVPGLKVLTSGPIPKYPSELLGSLEMSEVIHQLRKSFDITIFDTPAISHVADTSALVPFMDAVVLVVSRATSRKEQVMAACKQLEENNAKLIGFIVNRAGQHRNYYYRERKTTPLKKISEIFLDH